MCENEQKPEPWKRELRSHTHENQELRSWSLENEQKPEPMKNKSSGAGAVCLLDIENIIKTSPDI